MKSKFQKPDSTYPHGSLREQPEILLNALKKIEQMSDPGSYERAIIEMKSIAAQALADYHKFQKEETMSNILSVESRGQVKCTKNKKYSVKK